MSVFFESALNWALLVAFIPTFFFVSITPGLCMTLSMTLGMTVGVRRAMWMMWGELFGVGLVAVCSVLGVAAIMLEYPHFFTVFKLCGGLYLAFLGWGMWHSKGKMAVNLDNTDTHLTRRALMTQGFVTAIANPKGWAFFIALLPPFIEPIKPLIPQLSVLVSIILILEFSCLMLYCLGGNTLRHFLMNGENVRWLNRIAGSLMIGVGFWLILG